MWAQHEIQLLARTRGFHLITREIIEAIPELPQIRVGLMNLLIQHTSASLTINENADPDVRTDFESFINRAVPENEPYFLHRDEGSDDMPAHIKASLMGATLTLPISNGRLNLGTWQGIYLCEHRNHGGRRRLLVTVNGEQ